MKAKQATVSERKKAQIDGHKHRDTKGRQTCGYLPGRHTLPVALEHETLASVVKRGHQSEAGANNAKAFRALQWLIQNS
jgi:hypothetical protein